MSAVCFLCRKFFSSHNPRSVDNGRLCVLCSGDGS